MNSEHRQPSPKLNELLTTRISPIEFEELLYGLLNQTEKEVIRTLDDKRLLVSTILCTSVFSDHGAIHIGSLKAIVEDYRRTSMPEETYSTILRFCSRVGYLSECADDDKLSFTDLDLKKRILSIFESYG